MTPPLSIDDEVEVIDKGSRYFGQTFVITHIQRYNGRIECTADGFPWYPASSLRLVASGLKIGDWVQVIGQPKALSGHMTGQIDRITRCGPQGGFRIEEEDRWYDGKDLRKLTPAEVQAHFHPEIELSQDVKKKIVKAFLAQIARSDEVEERLAAIQDRLKEDRNLMMEIEERFDERQDDLEGAIKTMGQTIGKQQERLSNGVVTDLHHRIEKLENHHRREEMPDCKPNDAKIRVSITRGGIEAFAYFDCPIDGMKWSKKVLDGMRSGKP